MEKARRIFELMMKLKIYLDTSVISAYFDFRKPIRQLITQKWIQYNAKEFEIFISTLVLDEILTVENLGGDQYGNL
jgi:predicted nucleic acid-binding protein